MASLWEFEKQASKPLLRGWCHGYPGRPNTPASLARVPATLRGTSQRPHAPGVSRSLTMEKRLLDPLGRRFSPVGPMGVSQTLTLLPGHLMQHCSGHRARREGHRQLGLVQRACSCLSPLKASAKSSHAPDSALMLSSASLLCPTWPPSTRPRAWLP